MSVSSRARHDAVVRGLNPIPAGPDDRLQQDTARLLALAEAHPRELPAQTPVPGPRRRRRRGAVALVVAGACLAGGGVAVAGGWDEITAGWADMGGPADHYRAGSPRLVARGSGTSNGGPTDLQLWVAPNGAGGECASVRAQGFGLDTCSDGRDRAPTVIIGLTGDASYHAARTGGADYLYGHVDPHLVTAVRLSAPDRVAVTTAVDPVSGYWVTSINDTTAASPLTLTATDPTGRTVASQPVTYDLQW